MVLLIEGPDQDPHWARSLVPRGVALTCIAVGAVFQVGGYSSALLRAMFLLDVMTMMGSESAVNVFLSNLSQTKKGMLLIAILLLDTFALFMVLAELPETWAARLGRVLLFFLGFGCSAGCWVTLLPQAAELMDDDWDDDDWDAAPDAEGPLVQVHWPQPLELPEEVAAKPRSEIPEAFVCPLTMGVMRQPAITPAGTTYDHDALANWIDSQKRYPAGEAGALHRDELVPNLALRNMIEAWLQEQKPPPPPAPPPAPAPAPAARPSRSPARRRR